MQASEPTGEFDCRRCGESEHPHSPSGAGCSAGARDAWVQRRRARRLRNGVRAHATLPDTSSSAGCHQFVSSSVRQSINQSINPSTNQSLISSFIQSFNHSIIQSSGALNTNTVRGVNKCAQSDTRPHVVAPCGFCVGFTRPSPRGGIPSSSVVRLLVAARALRSHRGWRRRVLLLRGRYC